MNKRSLNEGMAICLAITLVLTLTNLHHPLHYVFGIFFFGLLTIHIALHWKWFRALFNQNPSARAKLVNVKTNFFLFFFFTICGITGILNLLDNGDFFSWSRHQGFHVHILHGLSAFAAIVTLAVHAVMHRKWAAAVLRRTLGQTSRPGSASLEN